MFEKIGLLAEQMATSVSRRRFLGRLGRGAMTAAGVLGGLLAFPTVTAAVPPDAKHCCLYECTSAMDGSKYTIVGSQPCKKTKSNSNGDHCVRIVSRIDCGR